MTNITQQFLTGYVVRLITDDELIFNLGSSSDVTEGMLFEVLDPTTEDVIDPRTGNNLGSIERVKSQVRVITVAEQISLARVFPSRGRFGISVSAETLMGPKPASGTLSGNVWPDGVKVGDPIRYTGQRVQLDRAQD
jgi:hypothetical protein